ncbi:MAG: dynamin family protein [Acidobacteria bacterium]|nr:dynamin family protein [Acidobacteriota bacterium]
MSQSHQLKKRLRSLEKHLSQENPILLQTVSSFRKLDRVCHRLGLLEPAESFATRISWWPMISVLGTYSSGKSTFINHYVGQALQITGNQAVDDRFTVVCYGQEDEARVLPGLALDADPRFPFYRLSRSIEELATGEGRRIDAYLQLKTCSKGKVRGKIIIDSPGFDADDQRTSILRITDHIIDLSDLVLVFFDARHPEAGTMRDTLDHLVAETISRPDSSKFLYVLNQIDTTAREDNPEDVIASWQRALAQKGLTAGRFYRIYNPTAAVAIDDDTLRQRFEAKRDVDMKEIHDRMEQVGIDRAYRVVGALEQTARDIQDLFVPKLQALLLEWRRRVLRLDAVVFGMLAAAVGGWTLWTGEWDGLSFSHPTWAAVFDLDPLWQLVLLAVALVAGGYLHARLRGRAARAVLARLAKQPPDGHGTRVADSLPRAFRNSAGGWRSIFWRRPVGWEPRSRRRVADVLLEANGYVQLLNDRYTDPSGTGAGTVP